jgi:hypothetical protein
MFSQNPQIGSQMVPKPIRLDPLVPYEDSSRYAPLTCLKFELFRENSQNTIQNRRRAVIEDYSQQRGTQRKSKRKYRPGTKALMEIRKYQRSTARLIQRAPFVRVVKDLVRQVSRKDDLRIQADAVSALQEAESQIRQINFYLF